MTDVGERLGPFLMIERIGRGGMGEVWLAQPVAIPGVRELCVVKTVRAEVADDADALRRFADETRLAMLLHHPHISRVVDAGRAGEERYLALALVEGVDLLTLSKRLAEKDATLDESVTLWIMACALDALAFAHAAKHPLSGEPLGVVHRDISPQNIMCARSGNAHVIDFGLALSSVKQARTEQDIVLGKLAYMAPEQARGDPVDARVDIYALGVVFYELVTGSRYWGDLDHQAIWQRAGSEDWTPPALSSLPRDIAAVLGSMIARAPHARASDAAERLEALMPLLIARGGPGPASARLAQIVDDNAVPELQRVGRARTTMVALPEDAPTEGLDPQTESLALAEAAAVAAALASPTIAMTAVAMPAFDAPPNGPRMMRALDTARVDIDGLDDDPSTLLAPRTRKAPLAAVAAGVLALAVVGGFVLASIMREAPVVDAGASSVVAIGAVDRAMAAGALAVDGGAVEARAIVAAGALGGAALDAASDEGAREIVREAARDAGVVVPTPRKKTLDERLSALARCNERCAVLLRKGRANGPFEQKSREGRAAIETTLRNCEVSCRKAR